MPYRNRGSNTAQNTHPYPITDNINHLHSKYIRAKIGIAHNGIASNYNPSISDTRDINDTQNFIATYLTDLYKHYKDFYNDDNMTDAIEMLTNSKFAILDVDDNITTIGYFNDDDGLLFSNNTYKNITYYGYNDYNYKDDYQYWIDKYRENDETKSDEEFYDELEKENGIEPINYDVEFYDIPTEYYIEYDDDMVVAHNYCVNEDGDLFKYDIINDKYNYITSDYYIFNEDFEPIDMSELVVL